MARADITHSQRALAYGGRAACGGAVVRARAGLVSACGVRDGLVVVRVASHGLGEGGGVAAARAAAQFGSRACPEVAVRRGSVRGSPRRVLGDSDAGAAYNVFPPGLFSCTVYRKNTKHHHCLARCALRNSRGQVMITLAGCAARATTAVWDDGRRGKGDATRTCTGQKRTIYMVTFCL